VSSSSISGNETGVFFPSGQLLVRDSLIADNREVGISLQRAWASISDSVIADNSAGGIAMRGGLAHVTRTMLTGNTAESGGAISVHYYTGYLVPPIPGNLVLEHSAVFNNQAERGGGVHAVGSNVEVIGSTVSGNVAPAAAGILSKGRRLYWCQNYPFGSCWSSDTSTIVTNCTITDNSTEGLAFEPSSGGLIELSNNILAHNGHVDCSGDPGSSEYASSHNLFSDAGCQIVSATDLTYTDPRLLPLADNGGPTPTQALEARSPAIDAGGDECPATDQRGVTRPQDGNNNGVAKCDIGAFEYEPRVIAIQIDIKPDSPPNSINPNARGVIPVSILGSDTFDVADVDVTTLGFGPEGAPIAHLNDHLQDVNLDGYVDLVTHYRTRDTGIACGDESTTLTGETLDGQLFAGTDSIRTVGCRETRRPAIWMKDQNRLDKPRSDGLVNIERD
jgi:hypothetical protein